MTKRIPTRRTALAALASAGAAAGGLLPAAGAACEPHPDQALLELGEEFDRLHRHALETAARLDAHSQWLDSQFPPYPAALRYRVEDHVELEFLAKAEEFYDICDIRDFRKTPRRRRSPLYIDVNTHTQLTEAEAAAKDPADVFKTIVRRRCPIAQARADEIVAAWDEHFRQVDAICATAGGEQLEQADDEAWKLKWRCVERIIAAEAKTVEGLRVRARVIAAISEDDFSDPGLESQTMDGRLVTAVVRDLISML